ELLDQHDGALLAVIGQQRRAVAAVADLAVLRLPFAVVAPPLEGGGGQLGVAVGEHTDVLDADAVGNAHACFRLRRGLAAVEPFGESDALLVVIAERLVEGMDLGVVAADHQLQLGDAARAKPVFRRGHDLAAIILAAMVGIDADVIDPAAVTVMADQHGRHQRAVVAAEQDRRIALLPRQRDVAGGIVPFADQAGAMPEASHLRQIAVLDRGDDERGRFAHSTLPGFMMPLGSSIALNARISSIAVLSFTSGNSSRLSTPMPCSAEIEPPILSTMSNTTLLTSCHRFMKSAVSPPTGWLTL